MNRDLNVVPEDFSRAMTVIARPDDLDHGTTGAIARWMRTGRSVPSVVVTDGETELPTGRAARPRRRRPPRRRVAPAGTWGTWRVAA